MAFTANKKFKIYQLPIGNKLAFNSYNENIDLTDYEKVYDGVINFTGDDLLEEIFYILNMEHPSDYKGRSLSVSDIIEVDEEFWFCDTTGFKLLIKN